MKVLSALRIHQREKRARSNPLEDWRHRWAGDVYQRPCHGEWRLSIRYDRRTDQALSRPLRRWTPSGFVRWLLHLWWARRWF